MEPTEKVLIVDDNKTMQNQLIEILQDFYQLEVASSGEEALEGVEQFMPDIILLDVILGEVDGYEVCQLLRQKVNFHDMKIIFLTAKTTLSDKLKGYKSGGDDYITKPFNASELLAKLAVYSKLQHKKHRINSGSLNDDDKDKGIYYEIKRKLRYITHIRAESPYCNVYCTKEKGGLFKVRISIRKLEEFFKESSLMRVHRSYLVNSRFISSILRQNNHEEQIHIFNNLEKPIVIPVGKTYQSSLRQKLPSMF